MKQREPDFNNLIKVLSQEKPDRPTLFEFFLNKPLYDKLAGPEIVSMNDELQHNRILIHAFKNTGYDYATIHPPQGMSFTHENVDSEESISLNDYRTIFDQKSFDEYNWPNPDKCDYDIYEKTAKELPDGMKMVVCGPGGVLENVIMLVGYDNMCMLTVDNEELLQAIFDNVGSRLVRHYELACQYSGVGALISNDDWGFKSQTMLSPNDFRKFLFPWHKKIVEVCHNANRKVILHSCGNLASVMDEIIDDMGYDGKHSYEDTIEPVEDAYKHWGSRIGIMGGIDLDYICRKTPAEIKKRALNLLEMSADKGSYALGSGNSIPEYVPDENYFAMISAIHEF